MTTLSEARIGAHGGAQPAKAPKTPRAKAPKGAKAETAPEAAPRRVRAPKAATAPATAPTKGKKAEALAQAQKGKMPVAPDFSAETHKRFRPALERLVAAAKASDVKALENEKINPISSSPKALDRYRTLALIAIAARSTKEPVI